GLRDGAGVAPGAPPQGQGTAVECLERAFVGPAATVPVNVDEGVGQGAAHRLRIAVDDALEVELVGARVVLDQAVGALDGDACADGQRIADAAAEDEDVVSGAIAEVHDAGATQGLRTGIVEPESAIRGAGTDAAQIDDGAAGQRQTAADLGNGVTERDRA